MNIIFSDLSVSVDNQPILRSVSGTIHAGKITAIIGPNGSGKTTLMASLIGLQKISCGKVMVGDYDCHNMDAKSRAQIIGYLPQKNEVNWNISVRHLVELGQMPVGKVDTSGVTSAMVQTQIAHLTDRKVMTLSGGELSRVLFARVLAGDPQWIMLDEPMAHLDLAHQLDMAQLLKFIMKQGKSIVIILHDLHQAAQFADNIITMSSGKIDSMGDACDVINSAMLRRVFGIHADIDNDHGRPRIHNVRRIKA